MHGSLETGSPARARSGRLRAGLLLSFVSLALALLALGAAPLAGGATYVPPPGVIGPSVIGPGDGGGSSTGCVSHWVDWHDDTITGTIGIHGPTSWCWSGGRVTSVSWNQSPFTTGFWTVSYFGGPWGVGAWCAGGAAAEFQGNYQMTYPGVGGSKNGYMRIRIVVCAGGYGSVDRI
jgi:hypothetical protein